MASRLSDESEQGLYTGGFYEPEVLTRMANDEQGGSNADVVLADAYLKGIEWGTRSPINVRVLLENLELKYKKC